MFIPDPDFYPSRIPDPGSRIPDPKTVTKERWKKICYHNFFCSHKFHKIEYYVIFERLKKKIWANFQRIVEVFTPKIFNMLSNIWVWDPGSEIRVPEKTYSGSRIQGSKRHRIPDPDPQHWYLLYLWMRSSRVLRASDCQCRRRNSPGLDPCNFRNSGIWRAAVNETVFNKNPL